MDNLTKYLARRISTIASSPFQKEASEAAQVRLLDSVACAFGAFDDEFCVRMRRFLATPAVDGGARLWGATWRTTLENATLANGIMARYLDMNDTVLGLTGGHPSDMIPALLGLGEELSVSGEVFLRAVVIAYELYCGLCQGVALAEVGVDQSIAAALGTAGGAAYLLGVDEEMIAHALALAVTSNVALFNVRTGELSEWKACSGPNAARAGLFAARLAAHRVTGPSGVFQGEGGLETITGPIAWPEEGAPLILKTHIKRYPVCYHGQAAADAAIKLRSRTIDEAAIESILIEVNRMARDVMGGHISRWTPSNRETADHSLPFTVGVALRKGAMTPADYDDAFLNDADLLAFLSKMEVTENPAYTQGDPNRSPARITVRLASGDELVQECIFARGHAENPLTMSEIGAKFHMLWPANRGGRQAEVIIHEITRLSEASSVTPLMEALCR